MRIDPNLPPSEGSQTNPVSELRTNAATSTPSSSAGASELNDTVQLSPDQATLRFLSNQLNQTPDIRSDQVNALRLQVQAGAYNRSSDAAAGAVVNELFGAAAEG